MSQARAEQSIVRRVDSIDRKQSSGVSVWSIFGGAALVLLAAAVIVNLPDIKRYIKISTM
ncbi:MAG TPA: hypothetical protein VGN86_04020 [Pyrinomonadaceae bacterium]|jgi:hypothetical protein|nr:hypothetical protein [Pyrinomonadaceae bacterium]